LLQLPSGNWLLTKISRMLSSAIIIYLLAVAFVYFSQRSLLYLPQKTAYEIDEQSIQFESDLILNGWVINPDQDNAVIYYGGNAESIEYNIPELKHLLSDYTIYLVPYRGYGDNAGSPSEAGLFKDALAVYDTIKSKHQSISLIGRSLGSAVAAFVASRRDVKKLILVTPFDSMVNVAKHFYWWLPVSLLIKDRYESWRIAGNIHADTLLIVAEKDKIIPPKHAEKLAQSFRPDQVKIQVIEGADHNSLSAYSEYYKNIKDFLK